MKTLIFKTTKISTDIWADDVVVTLGAQMVYTPSFNIGDMNITNATLVENVTPPEDWAGCKYLYDAGTWTINPNWIDPNIPEA